MANTYTLIASNTLSSAAASVTFSSIPGTYTDLVLKCSVRTDRTNSDDTMQIVLNSNTGSIYSETQVYGNGSTAASQRQSYTADQLNYVNGNTSTSNTFASLEYYIPSYLANQNKPFSKFTAKENNTTGSVLLVGGASLFRSTSAITSIYLDSYNAASFLAGSSFFLYGIKNS